MSRRFIFAFAFAILVALASTPVIAHFSVTRSAPAANQTIDTAPVRLQVWFSQQPAAGVSQLKLHTAAGAEVKIGKTTIEAKEKALQADLIAPLERGAYTITWRAAGDDGHVMTGEIKFTFTPKSGE